MVAPLLAQDSVTAVRRDGRRTYAEFVTAVLLVALGTLASCKRTDPATSSGDGDTTIAATPFVFVSLVGGQVGGRPASAESFYVGRDGRIQVSEESTDGVLHRLRHGRLQTESFFEGITRVGSADGTEAADGATQPEELPEYFAPAVVLAYEAPSGEFLINDYPQQELPEPVASLVARVTALGERPELVDAEPGLYARAQRHPIFDPRIETPDLVLDVEEAARDAHLSSMLRREMAFIRLGDVEEEVLIAGRVALLPDRSVHVQVGQIVYLVMAHVNHGDSD
jgi:hypothetical protein